MCTPPKKKVVYKKKKKKMRFDRKKKEWKRQRHIPRLKTGQCTCITRSFWKWGEGLGTTALSIAADTGQQDGTWEWLVFSTF